MLNLHMTQTSHSQNFITHNTLADRIVNLSEVKIYDGDTVIEIGAGKGILTQFLLKKVGISGEVVALEIDDELFQSLNKKFEPFQNIKLINQNILDYALPKPDYKIYSNVPFNISADILNKILDYKTGPSNAYLILQKETAQRFGGRRAGVHSETFKSISLYPFFDFKIIYTFRNTDFYPVPNVNIVLVEISKRDEPLIAPSDIMIFQNYTLAISKDRYGEGLWKKLFTSNQLKFMKKAFGFIPQKGIHAQDVDAVVNSFNSFMQFADVNKMTLLKTQKIRYDREQTSIKKINRTRKYYKWKEERGEKKLRSTNY